MIKTIVTHTSPDWDAIASVWLLKRYQTDMADADVVFVNTGNPDPAVLEQATAVVDTGRVFLPAQLRFDHHQLPGKEANETCATLQVAQHLVLSRPDIDFNPIWPIIQLIYAGDTGKRGADESRRIGIHALLSNKKRQGADNYALLAYGFDLLDSLAQSLISQDEAQKSLAQHTVYSSEDGLVVALLDAPHGATFAAHEAGARLVVFASELPGPSYARGIMRGGEGADVHCGELIEAILRKAPRVFMAQTIAVLDRDADAMFAELATWYRHEAGFFCGKGTAKAPCSEPMQASIVDIAKAVDAAWHR